MLRSTDDFQEQPAHKDARYGEIQLHENNNACCGNKTKEPEDEKGDETEEPGIQEELKSGNEGAEEQNEEDPSQQFGGTLAPTLLDDSYAETLSFPLTMPSEKPPAAKQSQARKKAAPMSHKERNKQLENHPNHLPYYKHTHYDRAAILGSVSKVKAMRGILGFGRYYIEKDWHTRIDPWLDDKKYQLLVKADEKKRKKFSATGRTNRIVDIFMDEVLNWECSREMLVSGRSRSNTVQLLWLGRSLAKKVINEVCVVKETPMIFDERQQSKESGNFYIVNRIPMDVFFSDKEALFGMLNRFMLHPGIQCRGPTKMGKMDSIEQCEKIEQEGAITRKACVHQNLSMSLKPCLVANCPNYGRVCCEHLFVYLPETITINSFSSMLHFNERFQRVEDLKGCVFVTKPAYLCNARGIRFFTTTKHFEDFYHMTRGKSSTRHGVLMQRYIECPRLFNGFKFTIRFFILVIVLPNRRVVGFIHYGIVFFAEKPYEPVQREDFDANEEEKEGKIPDQNIPVNMRSIGRVVTTEFDPKAHFTNYIEPKQRDQLLRDCKKGTAKLLPEQEDNACYASTILPPKCENSIPIYVQMLFVAQCMLDYMQGVIQDYVGTFQVVAVDTIIDARNKLWVLGASTNIFSSMLTVKPKQRHMMSAIIQETLGIAVECFYKSSKNMPLYWDYRNNKPNFETFFFTQDFNFFYETDYRKQTGYIAEKRSKQPELRLEERYDQVDKQFEEAKKRKAENMSTKQQRIKERREYRAKVKAKHEEES